MWMNLGQRFWKGIRTSTIFFLQFEFWGSSFKLRPYLPLQCGIENTKFWNSTWQVILCQLSDSLRDYLWIKITQQYVEIIVLSNKCWFLCKFWGHLRASEHGSYKWIIMLEKFGCLDLTVFHLMWAIGTYGNWKNQNPATS